MADVGFREGDRVAPIRVDRDVVAANDDGHDWNSSLWSEFLDLMPRQRDGILHDVIESAVYLHDERLEVANSGHGRHLRHVWLFADDVIYGLMCTFQVTHDSAHAVAVDVDDSDRRQHVLGILEFFAVLERSRKLGWIERGFLFEFLSSLRKPLLHIVDLLLSRRPCERALHARGEGKGGPLVMVIRLNERVRETGTETKYFEGR